MAVQPISRTLFFAILSAALSVGCDGCDDDVDDDGWKAGVGEGADCDDNNADINPGATEVCNGWDDDCDTVIDEADAADVSTWYYDGDADGYGQDAVFEQACNQPDGYVLEPGDCDDTDPYLNPETSWWADADSDGYGDPDTETQTCLGPGGYVRDGTDCDDTDADVNPGAEELCDDVDQDCDGDDGRVDDDGDGWAECEGDCDDTLASVYPDAPEYCNDMDDDCDEEIDEDDALDAPTWYLDYDQDGYGGPSYVLVQCDQPEFFVSDSTDCDDLAPETYPGAPELCDGEDNDCDGEVDEAPAIDAPVWYIDADGDGYGSAATTITDQCSQPSGYADNPDDCDDARYDSNPGADEYCNGTDDDCDGTTDEPSAVDVQPWYQDLDGDGYGNSAVATFACSPPSGYTGVAGDCDDTDPAISPGADEYCDGVDNNCSGVTDESTSVDADTWYADADADTYGDPGAARNACAQPSGHVSDATDCDDTDAAVNPGADEVCNDGIDNDCSGGFDGCTMDLADADTVFLGAVGGDQAGRYIIDLGDQNSDGFDEIMIGARSAAGTAGLNYIYSGPIAAGQVVLGDGSELGSVAGATTGYYAAVSATGIYDLDGNGDPDYAIGSAAPNSERGAAWVFFDAPTPGVTTADADVTFNGVSAYDRAGGPDGVAFLGDLDGDGYDDMGVGAYSADPGGLSASGAVYLAYGPLVSGTTLAMSALDATLTGEAANDYFGAKVVAAGDTDGDGLADLAVGATTASLYAGKTYLFRSAPTGTFSAADADVILQGDDASDYSGISVAAAGDQDADGYDDLLIGATFDDLGGTNAGCVYLIPGTATSDTLGNVAVTRFHGTSSSGSFGASTDGVGDYYADGSDVPGVLAGASNQGTGYTGNVYLFIGAASGNVPDTDADAVLSGTDVGDYAGISAGFSGDIDGAGTSVVMASTYYADLGGVDAGAAYLVFGFEE